MPENIVWYRKNRNDFISDSVTDIVRELADSAAQEGLHIEQEQHEEWRSSVGLLQRELQQRSAEIAILKSALASADLAPFEHVLLEFDFRRRGLRLDCVLLGNGIIAVLEFKRSDFSAADREQVTNYAINLVEFHEETRRSLNEDRVIIAPILTSTSKGIKKSPKFTKEFHRAPWNRVLACPLECDAGNLHEILLFALSQRSGVVPINCDRWLSSRFSPSSSIIDAAISLFGQHDVSAIAAHAAPIEVIKQCSEEVADLATQSIKDGINRIIFVSGSPGAGKTLVGLQLAFEKRLRADTVFVTGNSPLVEVLSAALKESYKRRPVHASKAVVASGYAREDSQRVIGMTTYKLVKAHAFLGERGRYLNDADGRIIIFDEAQRTYREGRQVLRRPLPADEAQLILESLEKSHPNGAVVIALIGHNQAINTGEMGIKAWFTAAEKRNWRFAISDETLALKEVAASGNWASHYLRERLQTGHLPHSMRFYRNSELEAWADHVLSERSDTASELASKLNEQGDTVWITRGLPIAKDWVRAQRIGSERAGLIATGQARRLAAEGLFVDLKPDIANWMLAPSGDIRSANMLETVQNQYQIQGLELDYTVVCWDLDLRRVSSGWQACKLSGSNWKKDSDLAVATNGYRVLLTRARKGMILFVPRGDSTGEDETRPTALYDGIAEYLMKCGAKEWFPTGNA